MRLFRHVLAVVCLGAFGCAAALAASDMGFKEQFRFLSTRFWFVSHGWSNGPHQSCEWRKDAFSTTESGLTMTVSDRGGKVRPIGCAEVHSNQRFGYGLYEARMRTAAGSGLNTAFFTFIGPPNGVKEHDEIDFEFLGKDPHTVSLTYWVNGKSNEGKVVQLGFDASADFHDYAFDWKPDQIVWYVDGKKVWESTPGKPQPHNPSMFFLSLWSGAQMENDWMGPFTYKSPVKAAVAWAAFTPPEAPCKFPDSLKCKQ